MSTAWSREEVEATVVDYLHMLTQELAGQVYNKTKHRQVLRHKLVDRSDAAIELKHQNISAVLLALGCPWISGYKPRSNFQNLLFQVVQQAVIGNALFDQAALNAAEQPATAPLLTDLGNILVAPPELRRAVKEIAATYMRREMGVKRDYLAREARNASLGMAGEDFVLQYERVRLHKLGKKQLSDRVEHVSATKGDGLGFDVLSFEGTGKERFIEVKTTAFAKETPFFVSKNEVEFSESFASQFQLYRLFEFRKEPKMFTLSSAVAKNCILDPISYLARFG
ncbi:MAG: DUF3883 domain-containing protein [Betaproteobacteria bacterium]|nr:DUF3883 domain-containing protein [Betaproteobacteria bacterium]